MPTLSFEIDGAPLFNFPLRGGRVVLGRADSCDVALPGEDVSRVHCFVEQRGENWWVVDRSSNGTLLNGEEVQGRAQLSLGDSIGVGSVTARFAPTTESPHQPTAVHRVQAAVHEEPIGIDPEGMMSCRVGLRTANGDLHVLDRQRTWIGGPGADIVVDRSLPARAVRIAVARGRPMVEVGMIAAFVAGQRVRETVPIYHGETLKLGDNELTVEPVFHRRTHELDQLGDMVGSHPVMRRLFGTLQKAAAHDHPVLLVGESGTGKELAARALHDVGPRAEGPYVAVNVAALTENLFESELFGHEKGSFTGASARQDGAFHRADGGTLFLDEIGELAMPMQAKLLRTLESGEVRRVGGAKIEYPDVRIVAATNRDLPTMVSQGHFRQDLYFRLCQLPIALPPLRARRSDVLPISKVLLVREHPTASLSPDAQEALLEHDWPGNVRELRNVLRRAVVMGGPSVTRDSLMFEFDAFPKKDRATTPHGNDFTKAERERVRQAMLDAGGNKTRAARALGIPRTTLNYKLRRLGLSD